MLLLCFTTRLSFRNTLYGAIAEGGIASRSLTFSATIDTILTDWQLKITLDMVISNKHVECVPRDVTRGTLRLSYLLLPLLTGETCFRPVKYTYHYSAALGLLASFSVISSRRRPTENVATVVVFLNFVPENIKVFEKGGNMIVFWHTNGKNEYMSICTE